MKPRRHLLLTFDYELYLGKRSGSCRKCLLEPTRELLDIFSAYSAKAIFFVDTTYLLRLREAANEHPAAKKDLDEISEQVREMVREGHDVYPHIHPHWLDAVYLPESNQWDLSDYSKYRFHNIPEADRNSLFKKSIALLREIINEPAYRIDAFRAGGWSIQPFEDFAPCFRENGIVNDFSVMPGFKQFSEGQHFDFMKAPAKDYYRFQNEVTVEQADGNYTEFCISSTYISATRRFFDRLLRKYLWKTNDRSWGDGFSLSSKVFEKDQRPGFEMVSVELLNLVKLPVYLEYLEKNAYMQFVSHPKMLSRHNLSALRKFMEKVFLRYEVETDYKKLMQE